MIRLDAIIQIVVSILKLTDIENRGTGNILVARLEIRAILAIFRKGSVRVLPQGKEVLQVAFGFLNGLVQIVPKGFLDEKLVQIELAMADIAIIEMENRSFAHSDPGLLKEEKVEGHCPFHVLALFWFDLIRGLGEDNFVAVLDLPKDIDRALEVSRDEGGLANGRNAIGKKGSRFFRPFLKQGSGNRRGPKMINCEIADIFGIFDGLVADLCLG